MKLTALQFVIPDWSIPWIVLGAAVAYFVGAFRLALALGLIPVIQFIVLPGLMPVIDQLLIWVMPLIYVVIGLLILQSAVCSLQSRLFSGGKPPVTSWACY